MKNDNLADRTRGFLRHKDYCNITKAQLDPKCDCGLIEVLEELYDAFPGHNHTCRMGADHLPNSLGGHAPCYCACGYVLTREGWRDPKFTH